MDPMRDAERGLPPFAVRVVLIAATIAALLLVPDARAHGLGI